MECTICKANKIGPETKPFGGFFCTNEHLQCHDCSAKSHGVCLKCGAGTKFLKMEFDSPKSSEPHLGVFSKRMSDESETESRLSAEHLSLNCSEKSFQQHVHQTHNKDGGCSMFCTGGVNDYNAPKCLHVEDPIEEAKGKEIVSLNTDPFDATAFGYKGPTESLNSKEPPSKVEQLRCLSTKVLQDFESENASSKNDVVSNYLKNILKKNIPPSYNCKDSDCRYGMESRNHNLELRSNELDPRLKLTCLQTQETDIVGKPNRQNYIIMQTMGVTPAAQVAKLISDKSQNVPIMDICMQKIFESLKEDILPINGFAEKSYINKISTPTAAKELEEKCNKEDNSSDLAEQLSNTYRADYNFSVPYVPAANKLRTLHKPAQQEPPSPKFKRVPCTKALAEELLKQMDFSITKTLRANLLHIPRSPILCPESTCQRMIFVSNFTKHLVVDHSHLPMEQITLFQCKSFFLDVQLFKNGASKCHLLYLMCDKIVGLGSTEYKDFLPILVMTSRISLHQICDPRNQQSSAPDYFLIWVTGIVSEELSISASLTVWPRSGRAPACHVVHSGQLYSIRNSQCALDVWQSGRALLLSSPEIAALTRNGKEMLNLQLSVH